MFKFDVQEFGPCTKQSEVTLCLEAMFEKLLKDALGPRAVSNI